MDPGRLRPLPIPTRLSAPVVEEQRRDRTLSKGIVDRLAVNGKDAVFRDSEFPGFGVRVHSTGRKVYVVRTPMNGKSRRGKSVCGMIRPVPVGIP